MTGTATNTVTALTVIPAVLGFMPFGVSFTTLMLGGGCFFMGSFARQGAKLYKKLDGTDDVTGRDFSRAFAAVAVSVPVAAVASCVVFLGGHVIAPSVNADAGYGGLLLIAGTRGMEGFQWATDAFAKIFNRFVPGPKPEDGK